MLFIGFAWCPKILTAVYNNNNNNEKQKNSPRAGELHVFWPHA